MRTEETFEFWYNYIINHPQKSERAVYHDPPRQCAPYLDLEVILFDSEQVGDKWVFFVKKGTDYWHRLDGPACIDMNHEVGDQWWIDDYFMTKQEFHKNPRVIECKLNKIIEEVLNE